MMNKGLFLFGFSCFLITGCVSNIKQPGEADLSGKFDGFWQVVTTNDQANQSGHNSRITCPVGSRVNFLFIDQGNVRLFARERTEGRVDSTGNMYVQTTDAVGYKDQYHMQVRSVLKLSGALEASQGKGVLVDGIQGSSTGCSFKAKFSRIYANDFKRSKGYTAYPFSYTGKHGKKIYRKLISRDFVKNDFGIIKIEATDSPDCYGVWVKSKNQSDIPAELFPEHTDGLVGGEWAVNCPGNYSYDGKWAWDKVSIRGKAKGIDQSGFEIISQF